MDRQALIAAAIAYARSNEDTPASRNLAELHARMAISLLTGEIGMYDSSFLSEDVEDVMFFEMPAAAPVSDDAAARLQASRDVIRDILGITSRLYHSEAKGAAAANGNLIREIEARAASIRDLLDRSEC
jgi:hypothetical protein